MQIPHCVRLFGFVLTPAAAYVLLSLPDTPVQVRNLSLPRACMFFHDGGCSGLWSSAFPWYRATMLAKAEAFLLFMCGISLVWWEALLLSQAPLMSVLLLLVSRPLTMSWGAV